MSTTAEISLLKEYVIDAVDNGGLHAGRSKHLEIHHHYVRKRAVLASLAHYETCSLAYAACCFHKVPS